MENAIKFNSVKITKRGVTLCFMSENAEQAVPVQLGEDDDIMPILHELEKLKLILLNIEGVAPAAYLAGAGYRFDEDAHDGEFSHDKLIAISRTYKSDVYSLMTALSQRLLVTDFKMTASDTVARIKAERYTNAATLVSDSDLDELYDFTGKPARISYAPIACYSDAKGGQFSIFGPAIIDIFNELSVIAQPYFLRYLRQLQQDKSETVIENKPSLFFGNVDNALDDALDALEDLNATVQRPKKIHA